MKTRENPPSIRRIETDRDDAYAFEVVGHIDAADVENIYGLLEGAYELHDKIDLFVHLKDYRGFDWGAAFRGSTWSAERNALKHVRRYAVVGGPEWMAATISLFTPLSPIHIKHFGANEVAKAWAWIGASPVADGV
jgi:hypothetical protein